MRIFLHVFRYTNRILGCRIDKVNKNTERMCRIVWTVVTVTVSELWVNTRNKGVLFMEKNERSSAVLRVVVKTESL